MKIAFQANGQQIFGQLNDTLTARDFYARLPLTLPFEDYASTEKIAYLPGKLSTEGAPSGASAKKGDITYYAPWGNLAIFYRDFGRSSGLITLGKVEGDVSALSGTVTIVAVAE